MQLGCALPCVLWRITKANPELGPVFMAKTDLSDAYMRVWLNIVDVQKLTFAITPIPSDTKPLMLVYALKIIVSSRPLGEDPLLATPHRDALLGESPSLATPLLDAFLCWHDHPLKIIVS